MEGEERLPEQTGAPAGHAPSGNSPKEKRGGVTTSGSAGGGVGSVIAWPDRPADEEKLSAKGRMKKKKKKKGRSEEKGDEYASSGSEDGDTSSTSNVTSSSLSSSTASSSSSSSSHRPSRNTGVDLSASSSPPARRNSDNNKSRPGAGHNHEDDDHDHDHHHHRRRSGEGDNAEREEMEGGGGGSQTKKGAGSGTSKGDRSHHLSSGSSSASSSSSSSTGSDFIGGGGGGGGARGGGAGGGIGGEESSGSWAILGQLGSKPRKETYGDDKESRRQYRQAKKNWDERKRTLIDSLTPDEVREYKKEKKELTEKERLERKRERQERRRLVKEKKKLYKKPKIGKLVTQETKSYELVCDMLLGIRVTVSKVSARPLHGHTVKDSDFRRVHNVRFPSAGSTNGVIPTPAHSQRDFSFRDYAPVVFRRIREHFGIEADDYLISLTGDYILSELVSPGQSGQFFYFSYDLRFMLKTVTRGEAKFLKAILPRYYNHIMQNPSTLIVRFFGFHRVAPHRDRKHYFVVMGNVFAQNLELHYRFDLKGSSVGRVTAPEKIKNDPNVVMKDQDFDRLRKTIALGPEKRKLFTDQINKDVDLLEQLGIMDYSLLVGIHDRRRLQKGRSLSMVYLPKAVDDEQLAAAKGFNADTDTDSSDSESDEEKLEQHHVTVFTQDQGGIQSTDEENQGTDYIYFLGIIDILQPFNLRKRAEHGLKSFRYDGDQISAVNPRLYARRFKEFMFARVRQPDTPQTPREVIGLPPRFPEGLVAEADDDEEEEEEKHQQKKEEGEKEEHKQLSRDAEVNEEIERKAKPSGEQAGSAKKPNHNKKSKKEQKGPKDEASSSGSKLGQPPVLVASAGSDVVTTRSGAPSSSSSSSSSAPEAVAGGTHESSPRVGNAGLVPKQLKVEKKRKQQKKQSTKKKKNSHTKADSAAVLSPAT